MTGSENDQEREREQALEPKQAHSTGTPPVLPPEEGASMPQGAEGVRAVDCEPGFA